MASANPNVTVIITENPSGVQSSNISIVNSAITELDVAGDVRLTGKVYASGSVLVADWAVTDATSNSYIKNKPSSVAGPTGAAGVAGPTGASGAAGVAGSSGAAGPIGSTGPVGPTGLAGSTGGVGTAGSVGATGPTGSAGSAGSVGAAGPVGSAGPVGPTGSFGGSSINVSGTISCGSDNAAVTTLLVGSGAWTSVGKISCATITGPQNSICTGFNPVLFPSGINGSSLSISGGKTFNMPHPDPVKLAKGYRLRHACVESPTRGETLYKYSIDTTSANEQFTINLPSYFTYLNDSYALAYISPTNILSMCYARVGYDNVNATATVQGVCQFPGNYNVLVIGTRDDQPAHDGFDGDGGVEFIPNDDCMAW